MICIDFLRSLSGLPIEEVSVILENKYPTVASRSVISLSAVDEESLQGEFIAIFLNRKDETLVKQVILYSPR